jgi:hypothetical protein
MKMKRKIVSIVLTGVAVLGLSVGLTACDENHPHLYLNKHNDAVFLQQVQDAHITTAMNDQSIIQLGHTVAKLIHDWKIVSDLDTEYWIRQHHADIDRREAEAITNAINGVYVIWPAIGGD